MLKQLASGRPLRFSLLHHNRPWQIPTMQNRSLRLLQIQPSHPVLGCTSNVAELMWKFRACAFPFTREILCCSILFDVRADAKCKQFSQRFNGPVHGCDRVTQKTMLKFTWCAIAEDFREACEVQLLCRDAIRRGVHLPKAWKSKLSLRAVDALADSALRRAWQTLSLTDVAKLSCRPCITNVCICHCQIFAS